MSKVIAVYRGLVKNDAFQFAPIINGTRIHGMILDTGAFELTFNQKTAARLSLPNLGSIQIGGVGGTAQAYQSVCTVTINGRAFANTPCIVDPGLAEPGLFGLRFFVDNNLKLTLNPSAQTLTVAEA